MAGKPQFCVGEFDRGLLPRMELAITAGCLLPLGGVGALLSSLGNVDFLEADGLIDQNGDAVRQGLHESFARSELETRTRTIAHDVGAQDARLQGRKKGRVPRQDAFFAFRRHRDNELGFAFKDDFGRRDQLERNDVRSLLGYGHVRC